MTAHAKEATLRRLRGCAFFGFVAFWLLFLLGGAGWISIQTATPFDGSHGLYCESVRPSQGGTVRWQLVPPGYYCEWEEDGAAVRSDASAFPAFWAVALAGSAAGFVYVVRGWDAEPVSGR